MKAWAVKSAYTGAIFWWSVGEKKAKARSQFIQFLTSGLAPDSAVEMRDTYNTRFADGDLQLVKITITEGWE
jgi:hypothetical protein